MQTSLAIAEMVVAALLIVVVLAQIRGSAGVFGSAQSTFRTRRGVERTLFQFTILLGAVFVLLSVLSLLVPR
ncbi:MAG: preprotein translocase subunit SecG [Chloroflexi bacterium]|nr:preprotein translocase subunit SecG [Chloroflexota bacterium]